jgi:hypothetical protein
MHEMQARLKALNEKIKTFVTRILSIGQLKIILTVFEKETTVKFVELTLLVQTIDFLIDKY